MYWRISSFPELDHLADADRRALVRKHVGLRVTLPIMMTALGGGLLLVVPLTFFHRTIPQALFPYLVAFLFVAGTVAAYQIFLIRIRGQLVGYLEQIGRHERLPMCLRCGYNLEGSTGSRCPECGHRFGSQPKAETSPEQ